MTGSTIGISVGRYFCELFDFYEGIIVWFFVGTQEKGWVGLNIEYSDRGPLVGLHVWILVDAKTGIAVIFFPIKSRLFKQHSSFENVLGPNRFFLNLKE